MIGLSSCLGISAIFPSDKPSIADDKLGGTGGKSSVKIPLRIHFHSPLCSPYRWWRGGKPSLTGDKLGGTGGKSSANDSSSGTFLFSSVLSPIGGGG